MMFATLDDLEGAVEMLVFGKALAEHETVLAPDQVVLVKGRVDHKEAGATSLVVSGVQRFAPSKEEIEKAGAKVSAAQAAAASQARPVQLRIAASELSDGTIEDLKQTIEDFPGEAEVRIDIDTGAGSVRQVRLGEKYRVAHTPTLMAELERTLRTRALPSAATG
jgi:DNA polymerase-3 subunit alpha